MKTVELPKRDVYQVGRGDYVRDRDGSLHAIDYIEAHIDQVTPLHYRHWQVKTKDGAHLSMYQVLSYHLRRDIER